MSIEFFAEDIEYPDFNQNLIVDVLNKIIATSDKQLDYINFIYCSDSYLLDINNQYLQHDYYTDIITFDYNEDVISSDIFISLDRVAENAACLEISFLEEFYRILIHGVLHLVGYDDKVENDKIEMTKMEDLFLQMTR